MAITKNPTAADAKASYIVNRAMYWAGEVVPVGGVLELTRADAASLLAAGKITLCDALPESADSDQPKAKKAASKASAKAAD